ncbi:MAG: hypothetical protein JWM58_415 [Rhizobium sp.]|nr:hypothetical protein [Rhizobium sp.]
MDIFVFTSFPVLAAWSVALLVIHVMLQARLVTRELGRKWNAGPRDEEKTPKGALAGRAVRASANFRETYPAFVALALGLAIADPLSGWGHAGALLWFAARLIYIPLYLSGIPYIRSAAWTVAMLGLLAMFLTLVM